MYTFMFFILRVVAIKSDKAKLLRVSRSIKSQLSSLKWSVKGLKCLYHLLAFCCHCIGIWFLRGLNRGSVAPIHCTGGKNLSLSVWLGDRRLFFLKTTTTYFIHSFPRSKLMLSRSLFVVELQYILLDCSIRQQQKHNLSP